MPRVIVTVTYSIKPDQRAQYLALAAHMKTYFAASRKENYSVFESKMKKNQFTEMFISNSMEEYQAEEENLDETAERFLQQLELLVDGEGMKYNTLIEAI